MDIGYLQIRTDSQPIYAQYQFHTRVQCTLVTIYKTNFELVGGKYM